jgi:hypothetical protein
MVLGILVATLTMAGVSQAQEVATIQGTIQSVDCNAKALVVQTPDGSQYRMYVSPTSTGVFVNSTPVSFCTLQQYVGSNATVSVLPNGSQLVVKRVDVLTTVTPSPTQNPSGTAAHGMPDWAKVAIGVALVGALVYFVSSQRHDSQPQNQPYYQCSDGSWGKSCPPLSPNQLYLCRDGSWRPYCP